jgi:3'(2'), 5'-bisphosphate nucleotidase
MATAADHTLAREVAVLAGDRLRAQGDRRAHLRILELLTDARPTDAVLSEEGYDDRARLGNERVWVVDPLDGTREFGEPGRRDWAVHIALAESGMVTVGAVALPAEGVVFATDEPPVVPPVGNRRLRVVTSRQRLTRVAAAVADTLDAELVGMGSAGAKAMAVVRGDCDVYAHAGGMYEWDSAAPVAVAGAAGLHVSRIDGSPLRYNREHPWLPDLLICRPELADRCLEAIDGIWW